MDSLFKAPTRHPPYRHVHVVQTSRKNGLRDGRLELLLG
jgi:hypothetical protein